MFFGFRRLFLSFLSARLSHPLRLVPSRPPEPPSFRALFRRLVPPILTPNIHPQLTMAAEPITPTVDDVAQGVQDLAINDAKKQPKVKKEKKMKTASKEPASEFPLVVGGLSLLKAPLISRH